MTVQPSTRNKRYSIHTRFILVICLIVFASVGLVVWIGVRDALDISRTFKVLQESLQQVTGDVSAYRFSRVDTELANARKALDELDQLIQTAPLFTFSFSPLRRYRGTMKVFFSQTRLAIDSTETLLRIGVPIARLVLKQEGDSHVRVLSENDKKTILNILSKELPALVGVNATLSLVRQRLETINSTTIPSAVRPIKDELIENVKQLQRGIGMLLPAISLSPSFLGYPTEKTYLLLLQNNAEARATGGFIGTYGTLTIRNGEIIRFSTDNVYNLDDKATTLSVAPPKILQKYSGIKKWYLRDSNWSPDFTQAAKQAVWFYLHEGGTESIDGVIALTPETIASLMRVLGEVSVDGLNFQPDQFYEQLQYQVEKGYERRGITKSERKDVVQLIANELLKRLSVLSVAEWPQVIGVLRARFAEKALMMYSIDTDIAEYLRVSGWNGEIMQSKGDSIMVVDSNMLSLKTDAVMDKNIIYTITEQDDGSLHAKLELHYRNNGVFSWTSTTYRDYVRILIPLHSSILSSTEPLEISQEYGKMLLGRFLSIDPQKEHSLTIEYVLPKNIDEQVKNGLYTLFIQKQSGSTNQNFSLNAHFLHPIRSVEPIALSSSFSGGGRFDFTSLLQTDTEIYIRF